MWRHLVLQTPHDLHLTAYVSNPSRGHLRNEFSKNSFLFPPGRPSFRFLALYCALISHLEGIWWGAVIESISEVWGGEYERFPGRLSNYIGSEGVWTIGYRDNAFLSVLNLPIMPLSRNLCPITFHLFSYSSSTSALYLPLDWDSPIHPFDIGLLPMDFSTGMSY